ncbi:glycerol-3-phosphate dehydrogenase, partial [Escherichia coli]|uniref:NAD(P)H-dependent glycerol-3-phosphate dehydrogenase n=1 Tax=Escherichia coli TaxID=562 RepID=UPI0011051BC4
LRCGGAGFGPRAKTALLPGVLVRLNRVGAARGADPKTFMGMAGLGDWVLPCPDTQSRTRRFGRALGAGRDVNTAMTEIGQVVEGYRNTKEVHLLAARCGVEMPICEQIFKVLYEGKNPKEAAIALLSRDKKDE